MQKTTVTVTEAARRIERSWATVHAYIKRGLLKAHQDPISRHYSIDERSLEELLRKIRGEV